MFSALDANNRIFDIEDAIMNPIKKYYCPSCRGELIIKYGNIRVNHFAHKNNCNCDNYDNDMSEWHRNWQSKFPLKNREVVLELDADEPMANHFTITRRRTDVLCYGYAIEFQNSPITSEEFEERNRFYKHLGKKVIWIFNMIETRDSEKMECYEEWGNKNDNGGKWSWKWASKTFVGYKTYDKDVVLIFQIAEEDDEVCYLERVTWAINSCNDDEYTDFKRFCTTYYPGNFDELMDMLKNREL